MKGEFETTAEFEERQDKWMARPILGAVKPQSRIALSLSTQTAPNQMKAAYDADGGLMTVEVSRSYCGDAVGVEIFSNLKDQGSYIGSNAFGVKKVIKRTSITRYCLDGVPLDPMQFAISRDKASQEKARLKVLVVGRLREPYVKVVENYSSPTITSPYEVHSTSYVLILDVDEVWVFNGTTGQIHFKPVPAPAPPSATANPGSIDSNGNTALHVALWQDRFEEAIEIIEKGEININHQNIFGATPLHLAVAKKNARVVKRLLAAGAVRDIADRHGDTPLMDARKSSLAEIVRLLDEK
jgi:hypothetical protein